MGTDGLVSLLENVVGVWVLGGEVFVGITLKGVVGVVRCVGPSGGEGYVASCGKVVDS